MPFNYTILAILISHQRPDMLYYFYENSNLILIFLQSAFKYRVIKYASSKKCTAGHREPDHERKV